MQPWWWVFTSQHFSETQWLSICRPCAFCVKRFVPFRAISRLKINKWFCLSASQTVIPLWNVSIPGSCQIRRRRRTRTSSTGRWERYRRSSRRPSPLNWSSRRYGGSGSSTRPSTAGISSTARFSSVPSTACPHFGTCLCDFGKVRAKTRVIVSAESF